MGDYLALFVSCVLINNILLMQYLGNCPFLGTSKRMDTAVGMACAVVFVLFIAGTVTWVVDHYLLQPWSLEYLRTIAFILVIASLVQFVELLLKKNFPPLYTALGIFLPLITTNCAVMGVCLINIKEEYTFTQTVISSFGYAAGFGLALILFASLRERIQLARVPRPLQDTSIGLITAGLIALSFLVFKGMV